MPRLSDMPQQRPRPAIKLKVPQVRALVALMPDEGDDPPPGTTPRKILAELAGFIPTTGTINRVLHGVPEGSSSGMPHSGLLALGLVDKVDIDLDGQTMDSYRITRAGITAVREWLSRKTLPPMRDVKSSTNHRYADDPVD